MTLVIVKIVLLGNVLIFNFVFKQSPWTKKLTLGSTRSMSTSLQSWKSSELWLPFLSYVDVSPGYCTNDTWQTSHVHPTFHSWQDHVSNLEVFNCTEFTSIDSLIIRDPMRWWDTSLEWTTTVGLTNCSMVDWRLKRPRGYPYKFYKDAMTETIHYCDRN